MPALEPEVVAKLQALCKEDDLDLKAFALMSLHLTRGREEAIRAFLLAQLQALGRREILVRTRWALALDYLGMRYAGDGEYAKAIAAHKKALEIRSDDAVTLVNLGNAYGNQGDLDQAMAWFQAALRVDPAFAQAAANLGTTHARRQDAANAAQAYLQAIRLKPGDPFNHLLLARMYVESGQVEPAIAALKVGLAYVPYDREMKWLLRELEAMRVNQK
jgi:tetratricopeptide (TPR) repeat protein